MATGSTAGDGQISRDALSQALIKATTAVEKQLGVLRNAGSNISIVDMFQMQMLMNKLSQLSEMSTSILSASNSAIASMARNVKS